MLDRTEFLKLSDSYGPFDIDACADDNGTNSQVSQDFCCPSKSFLDRDISGKKVYMNPPFDRVYDFLAHYFSCKERDPIHTRGMFILPRWTDRDWYKVFVPRLTRVKTYKRKTFLFTRASPTQEGQRLTVGPTRWPVDVYIDESTSSGASTPSPQNDVPTPTPAPDAKIASLASTSSTNLLETTIEVEGNTFKALIDSGATHNFIDSNVASTLASSHRAKLLRHHRRVRLANGQLSTSRHNIKLAYTLGNTFSGTDTFMTTELHQYNFILGQEWLHRHDPAITWSTSTVTFQDGSSFIANGSTRAPRLHLLQASSMFRQLCKTTTTEVFLATVRDTSKDDDSASTEVKTDQTPTWTSGLHALLEEFSDITAPPTGLPPHREWDLAIDLTDDSKVPQQRTYRMSPLELKEVHRQLEEMLESGWIRPSTSRFGAPILFARKKDGSLRMCVDYRELNKITRKNRYPLPRIDELLDNLHGATVFTSLDLYKGYHQVRIKDEHVERTAFRTRFGLFEYTVMPFGLTNAPATFMNMMNDVLRPYLDKFVVVYLDDILIFSRTPEEHTQHLRLVFEALRKYDLRLQLRKCSFGRSEVTFLGHNVSRDGIKPEPAKVAAVKDWPLPRNLKEIRSFLGFTNYYRRFVRNYSAIAAPLINLTKTSSPTCGTMTPAAAKAFDHLKTRLTSAPTLILPRLDDRSEFVIYTDASKFAIGAVLLQDQGRGLQPVSYFARKLQPRECDYSIHERELLAVVDAVRHYRCYIDGCRKLTICTDHDSLRHFMKQPDLHDRRARWAMELSPYTNVMDIVYRKGDINHTDALSRRPDLARQLGPLTDEQDAELSSLASYELQSTLFEDIVRAYPKDFGQQLPAFATRTGDAFYIGDRLCVPKDQSLRLRILYECHDAASSAHPGRTRTLNAVASRFWWPRLSRDVMRYVKSCATCQRIKSTRHKPYGPLQPLPTPSRPWEYVGLDLVTDLPPCQGYDSIVVFVDLLSKQAFFVPSNKTVTAAECARLLFNTVFRHRGLPRVLVSDRDPRFVSRVWHDLFSSVGTKLNLSTAYHPQTDGQSERTIQTLEGLLRGVIHPLQDDWVQHLPNVEFAYNNSTSSSTSTTPFYANLGYDPATPVDVSSFRSTGELDTLAHLHDVHEMVRNNVAFAKQRQAAYTSSKRLPCPFSVGDQVRINTEHLRLRGQTCAKLKDRFIGPFPIISQVSPVSFRLRLPPSMSRVHPVFHCDRLEPYNFEPDFTSPSVPRAPPPTTDATEYEVQDIRDVRFNNNYTGLQFLVRWAPPYTDADDSWEPLRYVNDTAALDHFLRSTTWSTFASSPRMTTFRSSFPPRVPAL